MNDSSPGSSTSGEQSVLNGKAPGSNPGQGSTYHYVIVRSGFSPEVTLAQGSHAAGESASQYTAETGIELPDTTIARCLGASKDELAALRFDLEAAEVSHKAVVETDGPLAGVLTAIGFVTREPEELKSRILVLAALKRWKP